MPSDRSDAAAATGPRRLLQLVERGLADPTAIPAYLASRYGEAKRALLAELYRRRHGIPRQKRLIGRLLREEEFVLVILDSCRYDAFRELYPEYLSGSLDRAWSGGNWTRQWMTRTWDGSYDLTYVSTTPFTFDYAHEKYGGDYAPSERFDEVIDAIGREWDPVLSTTPPEPVTDIALRHAAAADPVRAVVHYMQPHEPYIGETTILQWDVSESEKRRLLDYVAGDDDLADLGDDRGDPGDGSVTVTELVRRDLDYREEWRLDRQNHESINAQVKRGAVSEARLRTAYRDNLRYVLSEVRRLVSHLDCPVVVTSDHGEHLGDHLDTIPQYTHPDRIHPVLREVPWLVVDEESKGRNDLSDPELRTEPERDPDGFGDAAGDDAPSDEAVADRLEALGYR